MSDNTERTVKDFEILKNEKDALSFFFYQNAILDQNATEGPFAFSIHDNSIHAGTAEHHVIFEGVNADLVDLARQRGAIVLMEFEGQQPVRCTPCYLSDAF